MKIFSVAEEITIEHTNSPGNQLFDYMLNHDKIYGMRAVRMNPIHEEESPLDLVSQRMVRLSPWRQDIGDKR